jgi:hypothetical protein
MDYEGIMDIIMKILCVLGIVRQYYSNVTSESMLHTLSILHQCYSILHNSKQNHHSNAAQMLHNHHCSTLSQHHNTRIQCYSMLHFLLLNQCFSMPLKTLWHILHVNSTYATNATKVQCYKDLNADLTAVQCFQAYFALQCYLMLPMIPKFNATKTAMLLNATNLPMLLGATWR